MSKTTLSLRDSDYMTQIFDPQAGTFGQFCGIEDVATLYHGGWADPEVEWNGIHADYYDLEDYLWDVYRNKCYDEGLKTDDDEFVNWVKDNMDTVYEWFITYKEARYFGDFGGIEGMRMYDYALNKAVSDEDRDWSRVRVEYDGFNTSYEDLTAWVYTCICSDPDAPVVIDDEAYAKYAKAHQDEVKSFFSSRSMAA